MWSQEEIAVRLDDTIESWQTWSALHQGYEGPWRDLVHTSGRVLQALTYQPTGAVIAGATTSLPEEVGGERNWDYRYAWVRDAQSAYVVPERGVQYPRGLTTGETVVVEYALTDPEQVRVAGRSVVDGIVPAVLGVAGVWALLGPLAVYLRRSRTRLTSTS